MKIMTKIASFIILVLSIASTAIAGSEDWNGQYTFKVGKNEPQTISHSPNGVRFMFFSVGSCLKLGKGSSLNGLIIPANVEFCKTDNVEKFTNEVQKLGVIINKTITLGPTYTN